MSSLHRPILSLKQAAPEKAQVTQSPLPVPGPLLQHFRFVWATDGQRPKQRHSSLELAQTEARRLRGVAPGREFFVYEAKRAEDLP